jgi:hypothetical protein
VPNPIHQFFIENNYLRLSRMPPKSLRSHAKSNLSLRALATSSDVFASSGAHVDHAPSPRMMTAERSKLRPRQG